MLSRNDLRLDVASLQEAHTSGDGESDAEELETPTGERRGPLPPSGNASYHGETTRISDLYPGPGDGDDSEIDDDDRFSILNRGSSMSEVDTSRRTEERTPGSMKSDLWVQKMKVDLAKAKSEKSEALRVARELEQKLQASKHREVELQGKIRYKQQECQALGLRLQAVEATLRSEREAVRPEREALVTLADQATEEAKLVKMEKEDLFDELRTLRAENTTLKTKVFELETKQREKKTTKRSPFRRTLTGTPTARSNSFTESKSFAPGPISPLAASTPATSTQQQLDISTRSTALSTKNLVTSPTTPKNTNFGGRPRLQRSERSAVFKLDDASMTSPAKSPQAATAADAQINTKTMIPSSSDDRRTEPTNEELDTRKQRQQSNVSDRSTANITDDDEIISNPQKSSSVPPPPSSPKDDFDYEASPPKQLPPVVTVQGNQEEGAPTVAAPLPGYEGDEADGIATPYPDYSDEDPRNNRPTGALQREISFMQFNNNTQRPVLEVCQSGSSFNLNQKINNLWQCC